VRFLRQVNGIVCPIVPPTSSTLVHCILPAGAGSNQPVLLVSASFFSPLAKLLSYSLPEVRALADTACQPVAGSNIQLRDCPLTGGSQLTLIGLFFGASGASVFVGTQKCVCAHDPGTPDSKVVCALPASRNKNVAVSLLQLNGGLSPEPAQVSFAQCQPGPDPFPGSLTSLVIPELFCFVQVLSTTVLAANSAPSDTTRQPRA
jgi:hypothetical protein